jgi:photosystem II stability/assembly factor-like uncharacterized protein
MAIRYLVPLAALCAFSPTAAIADVDPETFPPGLKALEWREVGPYRGGRSAAVAGIPSDRDTYYMGATGGGVWKTADGGESWTNVSDGYFGGSVGAVAVSEWDPNVVYVGLGEKTVRGNVSPGDGIWKSTDAGDTWTKLGLEDSQHISRIRIHPKDPDILYVAAMGHLFGPNSERGVYRSMDGGETFEQILFVNADAGAVDLAMDPTNPRILYASFWRVRRTPYSLESGGEGSGLYKSTDGGETWESLSTNEGFPTGTLGIIGVSVSASNNQNVYAIVEAEDGGVFRSRDGGKTWTQTSDDRNLRQRAWYYSRISADPVDEESVYVLNVRFHLSKDGGKSFAEIDTPHGDNHDLWIDPADPERMIQANDGGANVSYNRGETWSVQSNQPTAQMYRVSTDNAFPYRLLGGQQDNTAVRIRSQSAMGPVISTRDWEPTAGGESGHIVAKPDDPDIVVGGSYGGYLTIVDHRTGERRAIDVWPDNPMGWGAADLKYRFQWNFPIAFSKHDPDRLFAAANVLFRSDDLGQSWEAISPDLTRNDASRMGPSGGPITKDNTSVEYYGTIFALAESQHEPGVIWAGSDDGRVHVTRDGGESWTDVTPDGLPEWAQVNTLDVHPAEPGGVYLAATRYKSDDFRPYLFKSTDWGESWTQIGAGIPDGHFTRALRADPERPGLLYAGTERGMFFSTDDGQSFKPLQLNLPIVPITDLAVKNGDLVAATQGRGYWILDDLAVLHQLEEDGFSKPVHLYQPEPTYRLVAGSRADEPGNNGTNQHTGVSIFYSLAEDIDEDEELTLEVFAAGSDNPIWTWTKKAESEEDDADAEADDDEPETRVLETSKGLHRHVWDLRYPPMARFEDLILWIDSREGPAAEPGRYRATMTLGERVEDVEFEVLPDPRSTATPEDYRAQFEFLIGTRDLLSEAHSEITRIRALRAQLESLEGRLDAEDSDAAAELEAKISEVVETITAVEEALYQTQNQSRQDPLNYPIRLNNKLTSLFQSVAMGHGRPTDQAIAVRDELTASVRRELESLQYVWTTSVPELNQLIEAAGMTLLTVPDPT